MTVRRLDCPNCGSALVLTGDGDFGFCHVCDETFLIDDNTVKHKVSGHISIDGLTSKGQLLKRAEQLMEEGSYSSAASLYHEIIDKHDAHESDAWWGLARVSVCDFTQVDQSITREQLGKNYLNAIEYARPDKRSAYEAVIKRHEDRHRAMIAERKAREEVIRKEKELNDSRIRDEQRKAEERARFDSEMRRAEVTRKRKRNRKVIFAAAFLCVTIALLFAFVYLPAQRYAHAMALREQGRYPEAIIAFQALNGFRQSDENILTCRAMQALQDGDLAVALDMLHDLDGRSKGSNQAVELKKQMTSVLSDWRTVGISPEMALELLKERDAFDVDGVVDGEALFREAHLALAGGDQLKAHRFEDVNADGKEELIVLTADDEAQLYEMLDLDNRAIALDANRQAVYLLAFGDDYEQVGDDDAALVCYVNAQALVDTSGTRQKLIDQYTARIEQARAADDMDGALSYVQRLSELSNTRETFVLRYDLERQKTRALISPDERVERWDAFIAQHTSRLGVYELAADAYAEAGELRIQKAEQLVAWKDGQCFAAFEEAEAFGIDIAPELLAAANRLEASVMRIQLLDMARERFASSGRDIELAEATSLLRTDLADLLADWAARSIPPSQVLMLLNVANRVGADVPGRDEIYRQAGLDIAASQYPLSDHRFIDWDGDGQLELLGLSKSGALVYFAPDGDGFSLKQSLELEDMPVPTFDDVSSGAQAYALIVNGAPDANAYALYAYHDGVPSRVRQQRDITAYAVENGVLSYGVWLEGSIERLSMWTMDLSDPSAQPVMSRVDWQADDYPEPEHARDAVVRYLEALSYGIDEESMRLLGGANPLEAGTEFSAVALDMLPAPSVPLRATVEAYCALDDHDLVLARYDAVDGEETAYFSVAQLGGSWRISGVADHFSDAAPEAVAHHPALCLNRDVAGRLTRDDASWYSIYLPVDAELHIAWRHGAEEKSECQAAIYAAQEEHASFIRYAFQASDQMQSPNPIYLPAGAYALKLQSMNQVEVNYTLRIAAVPDTGIEREPNDTFAQATPLMTTLGFAGADRPGSGLATDAVLHVKDDVDYYQFTLAEASDVSLALTAREGSAFIVGLYVSPSDESLLYRAAANPAGTRVLSDPMHLRPGTYYVGVRAGSDWSGAPYALEVSARPSNTGESEYNGAPDYAAQLPINADFFATSSYRGDVDFYLLSLPAAGHFMMQLDALAQTEYEITVADVNGENELWTQSVLSAQTAVFSAYLPASDYRISVTNKALGEKVFSGDPQPGYRMTTAFETDGDAEVEVNNTLAQANALPLNAPLSGNLSTASDIDIFKITLDEPGMLQLDLRAAPSQGAQTRFDAALADAQLTLLWRDSLLQADEQLVSPALFVGPGDYYIQLDAGKAWDSAPYQLQAGFEPDPFTEREPNASAQSASPLPIGEAVRGSFGKEDDVDWYRLQMAQDGAVRISFASATQSGVYRMTLVDDTGKKGLWRMESNDDFSTPEVMLPAGGYYVLLESAQWAADTYRLSADFAPNPNIEREPNDAADQATPLAMGVPRTGLLLHKSDADYFRFELDEARVVTLALDVPEPGDGAFTLELHGKGKLLWSTTVSCGEASNRFPLQMEGGSYEVAVKSSQWTDRSYRISLE